MEKAETVARRLIYEFFAHRGHVTGINGNCEIIVQRAKDEMMVNNENPGADEAYEPFCHAPGHLCRDYRECYSSKMCTYENPSISEEAGMVDFSAMNAPPAQPCKADVHYGPITVSGRDLRCSNCGYRWEIASEGPGPK